MRSPFYVADRYLIPSLYRLLSLKLKEKGLLEVEIAGILGVSTATVSRYLSAKRGSLLRVEEIEEADELISELADAFLREGKLNLDEEVHSIASRLMASKKLCGLHSKLYRELDPSVCNICVRIFR